VRRIFFDDLTCYVLCLKVLSICSLNIVLLKISGGTISEMLGIQVDMDFESMIKLWLNDKKYRYVNIVTSAVMWCL
jgi:hypothetical protein